ncbi:NTPase [Acrocarpospora pleiomorpha]|uniref:NTPase n=1 Tax=Acrocarpospora pleiomorpha TaxID=90975 RepID=A0A5M3XYU1_9ACTN|nr:tetratricopeptide repeat protein [Acrocarpospora pleiomorpha]GES26304.1 NTPase [Acrocarpospora pleiomorpha]
MPPAPRGFVNRTRELAALDGFLDDRDSPLVVVVSGLGGVGKTAISRRWAHHVSSRFADGQLYADLGAYRHGGGVEVGDVLGGFLRSLGVHEEWIPADLAERAALFRSRTADANLLVLVDDAQHAAEVVPLLPPSPGSAVVVTSHRQLNQLVVGGARTIPLAPLATAESLLLLSDMIGEARIAAEPEAAAELARLCGGLPIALRVAGARLVQRSRWPLSRLVDELTDDRRRLDRLAAEGEVAAVFDAAYRGLPPQSARLYRLLGSLPLTTFSAAVMEAVVGTDVEAALEALLEASLLEELDVDYYGLHDLVRLHAARCAEREEPADSRRAALRAVVSWYLRAVSAADVKILGDRLRVAPVQDWDEAPFATPGDALDWLEAERGNVLALLRAAAEAGWQEQIWPSAEALWALFQQRKHFADWVEISTLGAQAARVLGHRAAEARMDNQLARAYIELADHESAARVLAEALAAAEAAGDSRLVGMVQESYGQDALARGDFEAAEEWFARAQQVYADSGRRRGVGLQSYHLGQTRARAGRHAESAQDFEHAMSIMTELGDELSQAKIAIELGAVYRRLGRPAEAVALVERGLTVMRGRRMVAKQARAWEILADLAADSGDRPRELACLTSALDLYVASGNQTGADAVRTRMA